MEKRDNNLKREYLRKKQLELLARGIEVYQTQIDNSVDIDDINDSVILEQINSLKILRDKHTKLTRSINEDLNVLLSQVNPVDIKNFNKINFLIRNDVEEQMIEILHWLSIFENAQLTNKQKDLLLEIVEGYGYVGKHKDYGFLIKKLEMAKEKKCMNDKKRQFSAKELQRLFPSYYSKPQEYFDCYLNHSKKLDCYEKSVNESKRKGDYYRSLSLQHSIFPLELDKQMKEED